VRKVVLVGTGPGGNSWNDSPTVLSSRSQYARNYIFDDIRYFVLYGRPRKRDAGVHRSDRVPDHRPRAGGLGQTSSGVMGRLISDFLNGKTGHFSRLKDLHQPALIVSGDRDPFFPVKTSGCLYRELPNAQLAVYPKAGHAPHHQHPVEVAAQIENFLATS